MYARTTQLEIDTLRISVDDAVELYEQSVAPRLREQPGFEGAYVLATPAGRGVIITFWDTPEHADASQGAGWYSGVLEEFATLFRSPPGRERYEVRLAMPPAVPGAVPPLEEDLRS